MRRVRYNQISLHEQLTDSEFAMLNGKLKSFKNKILKEIKKQLQNHFSLQLNEGTQTKYLYFCSSRANRM